MFSSKRDPNFPDVQIPVDIGLNLTEIPAIRLAEAPPNTPLNIIKILEEAFAKAIKEPAYLEWAKRRLMVIHPMNSEELRKHIEATYPIIEKFQEKLKEK